MTALLEAASANAPAFIAGLWMTLRLLVVSTACALLLAVPLASCRMSRLPWLRWPALAYSAVFRGTPFLVQLYMVYYGPPQFAAVRQSFAWPMLRDAYWCALAALTLNATAYFAEVVRGGLINVPRGEVEAATAIGMGRGLIFRRIVLPIALRLVAPALTNEVLMQMKSTALVSTVTPLDVTGVGRRLVAATYSIDPLFIVAAVYLLMTAVLGQVGRAVETRLSRPR